MVQLELAASVAAPTDIRPLDGSLQFIGNATVLIQCAGFNVLTDPNFVHKGEKLHIGYGVTAERLTEPGVQFEDLPPIDLVVLSHLHADHFDPLVEERLHRSTPIFTTREAAEQLRRKGFEAAHGLDTWEEAVVQKGPGRLKITATPGKHGRLMFAALLPKVMGAVLEFRVDEEAGICTYITGDTLVFQGLREIAQRFGEMDVTLLHLGGTRVYGVLGTMDAKQGVELLQMVPTRAAIPVHFNDYSIFRSPIEDFKREVSEAGLDERVHYLAHGDAFALSATRTPIARPR